MVKPLVSRLASHFLLLDSEPLPDSELQHAKQSNFRGRCANVKKTTNMLFKESMNHVTPT